MSVGDDYLAWVLEQFSELGDVTARRMFGGVGLYHAGAIFGIIDDDRVYLKVGDENRLDFVERDMEPFRPTPGETSMGYFEVPGDVLEDPQALAEWARRSLAVTPKRPARRKPAPKARRRS